MDISMNVTFAHHFYAPLVGGWCPCDDKSPSSNVAG